jgi:hypothetical protein
MLLNCCSEKPILKLVNEGNYPGSVRYECSVCHKTTFPCYSTLGLESSISMAETEWNKIKSGSISLSHDDNI